MYIKLTKNWHFLIKKLMKIKCFIECVICFKVKKTDLLTPIVYIEFMYPSQAHESWFDPPLPDAHTKIEPFPSLPSDAPVWSARFASGPGPKF